MCGGGGRRGVEGVLLMLRELVAQPHCIYVHFVSCKRAINYVYMILL